MSLWWLQDGWTQATCGRCGARIWPEGDPDWGLCYGCFTAQHSQQEPPVKCDFCNGEAVTGVGNYAVCSEACAHEAERKLAEALEDGDSDG